LCFLQIISKHPYELGLDCVKLRAEQEPELGSFLALPVVTRGRGEGGANRHFVMAITASGEE
jgi:hypothetical protein